MKPKFSTSIKNRIRDLITDTGFVIAEKETELNYIERFLLKQKSDRPKDHGLEITQSKELSLLLDESITGFTNALDYQEFRQKVISFKRKNSL